MVYENLPDIFEFARVMKKSDKKVCLRYEEYLEYKEAFENLTNSEKMKYMKNKSQLEEDNTFVIKSIVFRRV